MSRLHITESPILTVYCSFAGHAFVCQHLVMPFRAVHLSRARLIVLRRSPPLQQNTALACSIKYYFLYSTSDATKTQPHVLPWSPANSTITHRRSHRSRKTAASPTTRTSRMEHRAGTLRNTWPDEQNTVVCLDPRTPLAPEKTAGTGSRW